VDALNERLGDSADEGDAREVIRRRRRGEATYAATKHGVLGYLKAVRTEMRGTGVHFTAVMPAVFDTVLADLLPQPVRDRIFGAVVPDQVAQVRADARAGYEDAAFTTSRAGRGRGQAASAE
jgi:NAD(P)-dependent dehydrogenase (short-subunit alcohol dehydrogenase family)